MNQFEFVLGIILIVMVASVLKAGLKHGGRRRSEPDPETDRLRDEVRTLKERIAVLERIATDKGSALEREIEQLRDR
ncbi:MAG: hypothetical protein QOJ94_258 [Sphingomonadales bacterium]|jgi:hypothetical protein|nr:hypothetical protein [Sphingomonadales bacterium]